MFNPELILQVESRVRNSPIGLISTVSLTIEHVIRKITKPLQILHDSLIEHVIKLKIENALFSGYKVDMFYWLVLITNSFCRNS